MTLDNKLFYGDNLDILRNRDYFPNECVDLIYLDPPFNSNRSYNVLFKDESGLDSEAQITAFDDTWHWGYAAERTFHELVTDAPERVSTAIEALRRLIGSNQMMAYLVMMAARLVELHRVLKPTGSLYLHCDPTASHYLKILLDAIFGPENFRNEIIWKRTNTHNDARLKFADVADIILFYSKSNNFFFATQYEPHSEEYIRNFYRYDDNDGRGPYRLGDMASPNPRPNMMYEWKGYSYPAKGWRYERETMQRLDDEGRIYYPKHPDGTPDTSKRLALKRYLNEQRGNVVSNVWTEIQPIAAQAAERLGYPTQKPLALLERIIQASSNPGDVVLDPFAGCGTAIAAAHSLDRHWIGIDITHLSVSLLKYRLADMFQLVPDKDYEVIGEPVTVDGARQLASDDPFQFQFWALSLIQARPLGGQQGSRTGKRGADRGIDGVITFVDTAIDKVERVIVQVKSGKVKPGDVRDLRGTVMREKAAIGVFITLEPPTREMTIEAASAGFYESTHWGEFPKIQLLTIEELLDGKTVQMPQPYGTFREARRAPQPRGPQTLEMFPDEES